MLGKNKTEALVRAMRTEVAILGARSCESQGRNKTHDLSHISQVIYHLKHKIFTV